MAHRACRRRRNHRGPSAGHDALRTASQHCSGHRGASGYACPATTSVHPRSTKSRWRRGNNSASSPWLRAVWLQANSPSIRQRTSTPIALVAKRSSARRLSFSKRSTEGTGGGTTIQCSGNEQASSLTSTVDLGDDHLSLAEMKARAPRRPSVGTRSPKVPRCLRSTPSIPTPLISSLQARSCACSSSTWSVGGSTCVALQPDKNSLAPHSVTVLQ
jgi:hypothetical protein